MRVFLCAVALLGATSAVWGTDQKEVQKELQANYNKIVSAFRKRDLKSVETYMSPDYTSRLKSGKVLSRAQTMADMKRQMNSLRNISFDRTVKSVTLKNGKALATTDFYLRGQVVDQQGYPHMMELISRYEDTWVRKDKGWKLSHSQLINGMKSLDNQSLPLEG